jgi:thiamine transporter
MTTKKSIWNTKTLALGAMCIALSTVLSLIKLFELPNGGSVTPASMLPMMLFSYVYGTVPGLLLGAVYGLLQFLFGGWFLSVPQMLMDYPIAFAMIGLAGLFNKHPNG